HTLHRVVTACPAAALETFIALLSIAATHVLSSHISTLLTTPFPEASAHSPPSRHSGSIHYKKQNNGGKEATAVDGSPLMRQWSYFYLQASHFLRSQVLSSTRRRMKK
ncbi:hypothetical protein S83_007515, partial [Arachis hypogaea]